MRAVKLRSQLRGGTVVGFDNLDVLMKQRENHHGGVTSRDTREPVFDQLAEHWSSTHKSPDLTLSTVVNACHPSIWEVRQED